jgi:hypothetical protein
MRPLGYAHGQNFVRECSSDKGSPQRSDAFVWEATTSPLVPCRPYSGSGADLQVAVEAACG